MPQPVRIQQAAKRYRAVATPSWLGLHGSAFQEREERGVELQDLRRVVGGARGGRACRCGGGLRGGRAGGGGPRGGGGGGGGAGGAAGGWVGGGWTAGRSWRAVAGGWSTCAASSRVSATDCTRSWCHLLIFLPNARMSRKGGRVNTTSSSLPVSAHVTSPSCHSIWGVPSRRGWRGGPPRRWGCAPPAAPAPPPPTP